MRVPVDTSVWVDHFKEDNRVLAQYLEEQQVLTHPFVVGELAAGHLKNRTATLSALHSLPAAHLASAEEVFELLERRRLWGKGLGWIDLHLLVSALLTRCELWTLDKRLLPWARELGAR